MLKQSLALHSHTARPIGITSLPYLFSTCSLRKSLLVLLWLFLSRFSFSQNLVPNPSFEDTVACPTMGGQIYRSVGWENCGITTDYFNSCYTVQNGLGMPNNAFGHQNPEDGNAYAGLAMYVKSVANVREFIGRSLSQSLVIGQTYFVSFYVSLADTLSLDCAINNIGAKFSTLPYDSSSPPALTNTAHISTSSIVSDKSNWIQISGWYLADSSYNYITIGNFFDDNTTDTGNCFATAYYYLDMLCVSADPEFCSSNVESISNHHSTKNNLIIYPNPADQLITINALCQIQNISIHSMLGELVFFQNLTKKNNLEITVGDISDGLYNVNIQGAEGFSNYKIQIIHK